MLTNPLPDAATIFIPTGILWPDSGIGDSAESRYTILGCQAPDIVRTAKGPEKDDVTLETLFGIAAGRACHLGLAQRGEGGVV